MSQVSITTVDSAPLEDFDKTSIPLSSRSVRNARRLFRSKQAEESRRLHDGTIVAVERHKRGGDYLKSMVYGGMDGIITTFAVVAGVQGASLAIGVVLVLGFANLLADGLSMGLGDAVSTTAENRFVRAEYEREMWETENYLEGELAEMQLIYEEKGFSPEDARTLLEILSRNKQCFVDNMMVEELGLLPPDPNESRFQPWKEGLVTFLSFLVCGVIPLAGYIIAIAAFGPSAGNITFAIECVLTAITLFALGCVKSTFTGERWWLAGLITLIVGAIAAGVSYLISWGLGEILRATGTSLGCA